MQKKAGGTVHLVLAFAGLSVRLIMINKDNGEQYKSSAFSASVLSKTIPYKRGDSGQQGNEACHERKGIRSGSRC